MATAVTSKTPSANNVPEADSTGKIDVGWVPDASTTAKGATPNEILRMPWLVIIGTDP